MAAAATTFASSRGVRWIATSWLFFIGENLLLSENRQEIIAYYGDDIYHKVYNVLSTGACVSIAASYWKYRKSDAISGLMRRGTGMHLAGLLVQTVGLIGISQLGPKLQLPVTLGSSSAVAAAAASSSTTSPSSPSLSSLENSDKTHHGGLNKSLSFRCPMDFKSRSDSSNSSDGLHGIERVSRHAAFWSFGLVCMGPSFSSIFMPQIVFGVCPAIFALIGGAHQDSRYRRRMGGYLSPEKDANTSHLPFMALLSGKQSWSRLNEEMKWSNASVGAALAALLAIRRFRR